MDPSLVMTKGFAELREATNFIVQGHSGWTGHSEELWPNVVRGRREWQTTPVFLPREPHGQYEKAKRYDTRRWAPPTLPIGQKVSNMLIGRLEGH